MTKYIIHGGFTPGLPQINHLLIQEVLRSAPTKSKVLLVYFAKETDRIEKNRNEDIEQFNKNKGEKSLVFDTATEENFINQVKVADIIYLHGGHTGKILETIKRFPTFPTLLNNKIVVGDSAGANVLASLFFSKSIGIEKGLGILPIKLICHCTDENKDKLNDFEPNLELVCLFEYQYKIFNI